jgi:2-dehydro-3-deoxyphosphogluconate aldolase/(4S)-4-hydroxy-2-oxoglutarate aldolase
MTVLERLEAARIVPVVVIDDAGSALEAASALAAGGITSAEITLRTPAGPAAIAAIAGLPDFTRGAGTVLTPDDVDRCADSGAEFIVSPGFDSFVVERALELGLTVIPGVATASELQAALRFGLTALKFFPADRLGGLPTIASLAAPFPQVRFMPSGGVSLSNAAEYLAHPAVFAVGGSWMIPRSAIAASDFDLIARLSSVAVEMVR